MSLLLFFPPTENKYTFLKLSVLTSLFVCSFDGEIKRHSVA